MAAAKDYASPMEDGGNNATSSPAAAAASGSSGLTLHLGVIDIPYAQRDEKRRVGKAKKGKSNKPIKRKVKPGTQTTGDVATWLENKYGVMGAFSEAKMDQITNALTDSIEGAIDNLLMGAPVSANPFASAESKIASMFKEFIQNAEIERMGIPGVPTEAAKKGVNHRLKKKRGERRPSFMDTHLYKNSAISWID
ncbi:hypothetical protein [Herbaspirillum sp.]|uniref:hypothetical protein n=2 Tax=unclassified Herbaspirillum TaxID=2624150 RepID=UPI000C09DEA0|nr:hypothetical protein [Herbaspirillum sp.]MAF04425.1 hypothetical protein [Herbaspirillum sp.]MBO18288.1 hypothetical protein [Herbaspirillum sp.]|tara:strand:- start:19650 stop:20234 length:585 start_codon:yes stop_codon:yes gene_type:complete